MMTETEETRETAKTTDAVKPSIKDWTVMVYMAGDNNLSEDMVTSLKGLIAAGKCNDGSKVNILAYFDSVYPPVESKFYVFDDRPRAGKPPVNVFDYNDPPNDEDGSQPESSTGDEIIKFVWRAAEEYPADNYCLILSGHGDAFRGKTLLYDENPLGGLTISSLREVLKKAKACLKPTQNFAVLGFDNCAMNLIEVGYEFRNVADYLVSSEGFIPQSGWEYEAPLKFLVANQPTKPVKPIALAEKFVEEFIKFQYDYTIGGRSVDLSVCDLQTLREPVQDDELQGAPAANLARKLNILAKRLYEVYEIEKPDKEEKFIREYLTKIITTCHWKAQTYFYEQTVDIYDFCCLLKKECDLSIGLHLSEESQNVDITAFFAKMFKTFNSIGEACDFVLDTRHEYVKSVGLVGPMFKFSQGVSVFFPWSSISFMTSREIYSETRIFEDYPYWYRFINKFTSETMRRDDCCNPSLTDKEYPAKSFEHNKTSGSFRTSGSFKSDLDMLKEFFSRFKNYDTEWKIKKP